MGIVSGTNIKEKTSTEEEKRLDELIRQMNQANTESNLRTEEEIRKRREAELAEEQRILEEERAKRNQERYEQEQERKRLEEEEEARLEAERKANPGIVAEALVKGGKEAVKIGKLLKNKATEIHGALQEKQRELSEIMRKRKAEKLAVKEKEEREKQLQDAVDQAAEYKEGDATGLELPPDSDFAVPIPIAVPTPAEEKPVKEKTSKEPKKAVKEKPEKTSKTKPEKAEKTKPEKKEKAKPEKAKPIKKAKPLPPPKKKKLSRKELEAELEQHRQAESNRQRAIAKAKDREEEEAKKKEEEKAKKPAGPVTDKEYNESLDEFTRQMKNELVSCHTVPGQEVISRAVNQIQSMENVRAVVLTTGDMNTLFVFGDKRTFVEVVTSDELDYQVDCSYIYAIGDKGVMYFGTDECREPLTDLFENIRKTIQGQRHLDQKTILGIPGINIFAHIYIG